MEASPQLNPRSGSFAASRLLKSQPDRVLCALALRGNDGAYETLFNRYHAAVYAFVFHVLGRNATAEDAEDIAQEAFSTAFRRLAERREGGSFKSWLFTIARNRAIDHVRMRKPASADVAELPLVGEPGVEAKAESRADLAWLVTAMTDLPPRQREALVMRELGGLSYDEIASAVGTTVPGVKQLISRARGSLFDAAEGRGIKSRGLRKELAAIVPAAPLIAGGNTLATAGIGGSAAGMAGAGLLSGTKLAAVLLSVAAVGGGAAVGLSGGGDDRGHTAAKAAERAADRAVDSDSELPGRRSAQPGDRSAQGQRRDRDRDGDSDTNSREGGRGDASDRHDGDMRESGDGRGADRGESEKGSDTGRDEPSGSGRHGDSSGSSGESGSGHDETIEPDADSSGAGSGDAAEPRQSDDEAEGSSYEQSAADSRGENESPDLRPVG